jgi:hypothetical protein
MVVRIEFDWDAVMAASKPAGRNTVSEFRTQNPPPHAAQYAHRGIAAYRPYRPERSQLWQTMLPFAH